MKVDLEWIEKQEFKTDGKMGTILKNKFAFTRLSGIREAFARAFSEHPKTIIDLLDDTKLDYAAAVRNVFIHKKGIVDRECKTQLARANITAEEGKVFSITGPICAELSSISTWLVIAVHDWIVTEMAVEAARQQQKKQV